MLFTDDVFWEIVESREFYAKWGLPTFPKSANGIDLKWSNKYNSVNLENTLKAMAASEKCSRYGPMVKRLEGWLDRSRWIESEASKRGYTLWANIQ